MSNAKYIYRNYPDNWKKFEKYQQDKEFFDDLKSSIDKSIKASAQPSKTQYKYVSSSSKLSPVKHVKLDISDNTIKFWQMLLGIFACFIFPPLLFWVGYNWYQIRRDRAQVKDQPQNDVVEALTNNGRTS